MKDDKRDDEIEDKPRIKVTDRRKFSADGSPRVPDEEPAEETPADGEPGVEEAAAVLEEAAAAADPTDAPASGPGSGIESPGPAASPEAEPDPAAGPTPSIADLPRDFSAFVEGMYLEAMLYLGALPDPRTGEPVEDLEMAKYKIDLLGMLQDKTRGNLTDEEGQQLEEVLYQLRMFYVQKTQGSGADADS